MAEATAGAVLVRESSVALVEVDADGVLVDEARGRAIVVSATAVLLWQCFDGDASLAEIAAEVSAAFAQAEAHVLADAIALATELLDAGFVRDAQRARGSSAGAPHTAAVDAPGLASPERRTFPAQLDESHDVELLVAVGDGARVVSIRSNDAPLVMALRGAFEPARLVSSSSSPPGHVIRLTVGGDRGGISARHHGAFDDACSSTRRASVASRASHSGAWPGTRRPAPVAS